MKHQRGWLIIGIDLLIVLGIYFLYSSFLPRVEPNSITVQDTLQYELSVSPSSGDTIPMTLSVSNPGKSPRTTNLPEGLVLFFTTGSEADKKYNFWQSKPIPPGPLELAPDERRSWSLSPLSPSNYSGPLYVALFIDKNRQGKVLVPER